MSKALDHYNMCPLHASTQRALVKATSTLGRITRQYPTKRVGSNQPVVGATASYAALLVK